MKKTLCLLLAASLLLAFTACTNTEPTPDMLGTPVVSPGDASGEPTIEPTLDPTQLPSFQPTPTLVSAVDPDAESMVDAIPSDAGFDELFKKAEVVALVKVMDEGEEFNTIPDVKGAYIYDMTFKVQVEESLKGSFKKGDTFQYNLAYKEKLDDKAKDFTFNEFYYAPVKDNTYLLFLAPDPTFGTSKKMYYNDFDPHCFELRENKLFLYTLKAQIGDWGGDEMRAGIDYASAKKEMTPN